MNLESQNIEYKQSWRDLTQFHASYPRNLLIAGACFKATLIDSWGSGISKIMTACKNEGLPEPRFEAFGGGVLVTLFRESDGIGQETGTINSQETPQKMSQEMSQKTSQKTSQKIMMLIKENPEITTEEMAKLIGIDRRNITRNIRNLKEQNLIRRIGTSKGGYWEIIKDTSQKMPQDTSQKMSQEMSQKTSQKIMMLIKENLEITTEEMAKFIGIDRRSITRNIRNLKEQGYIRRVGPAKGGHWEIIENENNK